MSRVNWSQASAEVVLLLLGIGIAVAADSFRSNAIERQTERSYLVSLRSDFATVDSLIAEGLTHVEAQLSHNHALLTLLSRPGRDVADDSLAGMLRSAFLFTALEQPIPTYRALVTSGELDVLRSVELRRQLAQVELGMEWVSEIEQVAVEQWTLDVSRFFIEELNATAIYGPDSGFRLGAFSYEGYPSNVNVERPDLDLSALWSQELANRIAIKNVTLDDTQNLSERNRESIRDIVALIDSILEPSSR